MERPRHDLGRMMEWHEHPEAVAAILSLALMTNGEFTAAAVVALILVRVRVRVRVIGEDT
jgi:hypothetical protein